MIDIRCSRGNILRLQIRGHALSAPHGQDLVCAAVSVLAINTANAMEVLIDLAPPVLETRVLDGDFSLRLQTGLLTNNEQNKANLLLDAFLLGIRSLQKEYPDYITYQEGGAQHDKNESAIIRQQKGRRKLPKRTRFRSQAPGRKTRGWPGRNGR